MINPTAIIENHHKAECLLALIQKADAKIQVYKTQIKEYDYIKSFYKLSDFERWIGSTEAAKERLIQSYNKLNFKI